jgi:hypothetical protein
MSKNDKSEAQNRHAKRRAMERYGIDLNRHKRLEMIHMIQSGQAECVRKQSHRVTIFSLQYEGKEVIVVYDRQRKTLASFLPIEAKLEDTFMGNYRWRDNELDI